MTSEERRRQLKTRSLWIGSLAVLAVVCAVWFVYRLIPSHKHMDPAAYFQMAEGEVAVVWNGTALTPNGRLFADTPYLAYASVAETVNPSIFYDEGEGKVIVTTPLTKEVFPLTEGRTAEGEALLEEGVLYLKESFVSSYTDAAFAAYSEPNRVVIREGTSYYTEALTEEAPIRYRAGIKSPIIKDGAVGERLQVTDLDAAGEALPEKMKGWTHVISEDGFAGYVEDRYLADVQETAPSYTNPIGTYTALHQETPINMVFHQTTDQASNNALTESLQGVSGTNVIAPTWFYLEDTAGHVVSHPSSAYVETAHAAGMQVWAVLNDFDGGISSSAATAEALSTDTSRSAIVEQVMTELLASGADGLNLDIELVSKDAAADYLELVREFSVECRKAGLVLSIDNYVPTFTNYLNRTEQARVADYVVVMCYDEHTAGSLEAGSVASLPFVKKGIEDTIAQVGAENTIAAIPFFTRLWATEEGGSVSSRSYGMSGAAARMEELHMTASWEEELGQHYAETKEEGITYQIWVEDADSIERKMEVVRESNCAGVAEWKLGLETSAIWELITTSLS